MGREMSEADQRWGARLKQARLNAGLSQKMLGIEAGIDAFVASTRINRYELGIHRPDLLTVRKLAKVLDVPVAFAAMSAGFCVAVSFAMDLHKPRKLSFFVTSQFRS